MSSGDRSRLRIGWLVEARLSWRDLHDRAQVVASAGYDGLWLSDHLTEDGVWLMEAWTTAAALLATVPRVEVGTLVSAVTLRPAAVSAAMTATLARIGQGRFVLGLGAGGDEDDHEPHGIPFPPFGERVRELERTCKLVRPLLTAGGDSQRVQLVLGGTSDDVLRLVASHADRWAMWASPAEAAVLRTRLGQVCRRIDRDPARIRCSAMVMLQPAHAPRRIPQDDWPALTGTAHDIRRQIESYRDAGFDEVLVSEYTLAADQQEEALAWLGREVFPPGQRGGRSGAG